MCYSIPSLLPFIANPFGLQKQQSLGKDSTTIDAVLKHLMRRDVQVSNLAKVVREYEYDVPGCNQEPECFFRWSLQDTTGFTEVQSWQCYWSSVMPVVQAALLWPGSCLSRSHCPKSHKHTHSILLSKGLSKQSNTCCTV